MSPIDSPPTTEHQASMALLIIADPRNAAAVARLKLTSSEGRLVKVVQAVVKTKLGRKALTGMTKKIMGDESRKDARLISDLFVRYWKKILPMLVRAGMRMRKKQNKTVRKKQNKTVRKKGSGGSRSNAGRKKGGKNKK